MNQITQHILVTVRSDGRYTDQQITDHVGQRIWSLEGVEKNGVDAQFVASTPVEIKLTVIQPMEPPHPNTVIANLLGVTP